MRPGSCHCHVFCVLFVPFIEDGDSRLLISFRKLKKIDASCLLSPSSHAHAHIPDGRCSWVSVSNKGGNERQGGTRPLTCALCLLSFEMILDFQFNFHCTLFLLFFPPLGFSLFGAQFQIPVFLFLLCFHISLSVSCPWLVCLYETPTLGFCMQVSCKPRSTYPCSCLLSVRA